MALFKSIQQFLGISEEESEAAAKGDRGKSERPAAEAKAEPETGDVPEPTQRSRERRDREAREPRAFDAHALVQIFEGILEKLHLIDHRLEGVARTEAAVGGMAGMVQFIAKGGEKRDRDLRAHITTELDKLGATLRLDASKQASLDVFKAVLPSLDDMDHVLREGATKEGMPKHLVSLAMVQKKLKDAFVKLGVEEIPIEEGKTHFDSELHDGEPVKADDERAKGLEKGTIVGTARAGYRSGDLLIRAAKVLVVG